MTELNHGVILELQ